VNIACPACDTVYRLDPANVAERGVRTRCSRCAAPFVVTLDPEANRAGVAVSGQPASDPPAPSAQLKPTAAEQPKQAEPPKRPEPPKQREERERPGHAELPAQSAPVERPATRHAPVPGSTPGAQPPPQGPAQPAEPRGPAVPVFGPQDPHTRARRLARALISDIKVYNRDRWDQSRSAGTLRKDFRDEILKSWEEYVEQVGESMAKQTPYFRDALNDILAAGERVF
jgi:predicted Zn finger-like uncharacterized protein